MEIARSTISVAIGAGLGGAARYLMGLWIANSIASQFPWPTFVVNVLGSFLIGLVLGSGEATDTVRNFVAIGFLGGFTTLSAVSFEMLNLVKTGQLLMSIVYVCCTILISVIGCWLGTIVNQKVSGY